MFLRRNCRSFPPSYFPFFVQFVDIAVPCNNKAAHSIGLMYWFLAREVLRLRGSISRDTPWEVMPDLFFYRDPEEADKEERERQEAAEAAKPEMAVPTKVEFRLANH